MARLQLDLSEASDEVIVTLMEMCDLRTKKDVVENALMLLGWAAHEAKRGFTIAAIDEQNDIFKEIQTPALVGAKRAGTKDAIGRAPRVDEARASGSARGRPLKAS